MLLKRAARGQLALMSAVLDLQREIQAGKIGGAEADEEIRLVRNAKKIALLTLGLAYQKYQSGLEQQQEVSMNLADIIMESFAMESSLLRARKLMASGKTTLAPQICSVLLRDAMARIEIAARNVLGTCAQPEARPREMLVLQRLTAYDPEDATALRREIASRVLARERYAV